MHSITPGFLAFANTLQAGHMPAGSVLRCVDDAGCARASAWANGVPVTGFASGSDLARPVRPSAFVQAHAHTTSTHGTQLQNVARWAGMCAAVDSGEVPRAFNQWAPEIPGDMALAQVFLAQIGAAQ